MEDRRRTEPGYIAGFAQLDGAQQNKAVSATPVSSQNRSAAPHRSLKRCMDAILEFAQRRLLFRRRFQFACHYSNHAKNPLIPLKSSGRFLFRCSELPGDSYLDPFIRFTSHDQIWSEHRMAFVATIYLADITQHSFIFRTFAKPSNSSYPRKRVSNLFSGLLDSRLGGNDGKRKS